MRAQTPARDWTRARSLALACAQTQRDAGMRPSGLARHSWLGGHRRGHRACALAAANGAAGAGTSAAGKKLLPELTAAD